MKRRPTGIGTGIDKRKCDYCVIDSNSKVLDRGQYWYTAGDAAKIAATMARRYMKRKGGGQAACRITANMWNVTYDAFEGAGIPIKIANTFKMALISKTGKKTDKVTRRRSPRYRGWKPCRGAACPRPHQGAQGHGEAPCQDGPEQNQDDQPYRGILDIMRIRHSMTTDNLVSRICPETGQVIPNKAL